MNRGRLPDRCFPLAMSLEGLNNHEKTAYSLGPGHVVSAPVIKADGLHPCNAQRSLILPGLVVHVCLYRKWSCNIDRCNVDQ